MEAKILQEVNKVLAALPEYWERDELLKERVIEDLRDYNKELIERLLANDVIKDAYSIQIEENTIFKIDEFISMLRYKNYWDNSYTKYSNEIGLTSEGKYLKYNTDVVLDFPHKDCVLEGGMTKEEVGKKEIYYHTVIAKEEIDTLLSPKVLTDVKKYNQEGEHEVEVFNRTDNLLLKGNNLMALHTIAEIYSGQVKLIYIDPPYNTGGDSFRYNDRFNHSTWLTFMKNRLEVAQKLLTPDGSIAISIDQKELGYLLLLLDEIFGKENRKNIITVKRGSVTGAKVINLGVVNISEYVVIYAKDSANWSPNRVYMSKEWDSRYNQYILNFEDGMENWQFTTVLEAFSEEIGIKKSQLRKQLGDSYEEVLEEFVYRHADRIVQLATLDENSISQRAIDLKKQSLEYPERIYHLDREDGRPYFIVKGKLILFIKDRLVNIDGHETFAQPATDIWDDVLPNDLHNEGGVELRKGKKPEKLISRIIDLCSNEGDIILDFFVGSGTTASVCLKKNRQFIAVEQLDYINELPISRVINTINGEQSGISRGIEWTGGGSFVYAELYELNQVYISQIERIESDNQIEHIIDDMKESAFLDYKINLDRLTNEDSGFKELTLDQKKQVLIESLDANQMYLSYSEMDDDQYHIPESVKKFNHSFYHGHKKGDEES